MSGGIARGLLGGGLLALAAIAAVAFTTTAAVAGGKLAGGVAQAEAIFAEAENLLRVGRVEQARASYERVIKEYTAAEYPQLVWRAAARVRLGDIQWRSSERALAGAEYVGVLEQEPPSFWTGRARLGLATVVLAGGDWVSAADMMQRVVTAAELGAADANVPAAEEARRRLTLIARFRLRPPLDQPLWTSTRALAISGLEFDRPVSLAAAADGQLLVVDEGLPSVLLIDASHANHSRLRYNDHTRPWWGPDGLPYLPTRRAGVIALGGGHLGFLAGDRGKPAPVKDLQAGARTLDGHWYLLDSSPRRILHFGPQGEYANRVTRELEQPVDLTVDASGRLYLLDRSSRAVVRFRADGTREGRVVSSAWRRPESVEVDWLGNIYVLDRDARTIEVFNEQGRRIARLGPSLPGGVALRGPRDIAVDGQGRLYVADRSASAVYVVQ